MIDIKKLKQLISDADPKKIALYLDNHNLKIKDNKVVSNDKDYILDQITFWDKRQLVKKINLNS